MLDIRGFRLYQNEYICCCDQWLACQKEKLHLQDTFFQYCQKYGKFTPTHISVTQHVISLSTITMFSWTVITEGLETGNSCTHCDD